MSLQRKLLVVTDLDATLLDHHYNWDEAQTAIARLRELSVPLILNSSKTQAEMEDLAKALALDSPIVAENGGLLAVPSRCGASTVHMIGLSRDTILSAAHALRASQGYKFSGFADWTVDQVAERTGLSIASAEKSRSRSATEPITWNDTEPRRVAFAEALSNQGIRMLRGGRFWHLMGTADKVDGMNAALQFYQQQQPDTQWVVVALGDSANDTAMLEAADIAVVIPHSDGPHLAPHTPRVVHAPFPASKGWNAAILSILDEYY